MSGRYAVQTKIGPARSRAELETILRKYGATAFAYSWCGEWERIQFVVARKTIRMTMPDPGIDAEVDVGRARDPERALERIRSQRWRALLLVVKAKLEAVEIGISTVEAEFLAHMVGANGQTYDEEVRSNPRLSHAGPKLIEDKAT